MLPNARGMVNGLLRRCGAISPDSFLPLVKSIIWTARLALKKCVLAHAGPANKYNNLRCELMEDDLRVQMTY